MKQIIVFLIMAAFCACGRKDAKTAVSENLPDARHDTCGKTVNESLKRDTIPDEPYWDWHGYQDSLRNEALKRKNNEVLKNSFLQEMYIRNVISVSGDSLLVAIPFDLHSCNDCGAPDCYTTKVSFVIVLGDTLAFPQELPFREHEYGCVSEETELQGTFRLVELTGSHVIYHSAEHGKTLVLFSSYKELHSSAYYFTDVEPASVNGRNVYDIVSNYDEEDENSICPFRSRVLTTNEYENFLR